MEINGDLLEADFWTVSRRLSSSYAKFRFARYPAYRERACKEERRIVCSYEKLVLDRDRAGLDIPAIDHQFRRFLECIFSKVACGERSGFAGQQGQVVVLP